MLLVDVVRHHALDDVAPSGAVLLDDSAAALGDRFRGIEEITTGPLDRAAKDRGGVVTVVLAVPPGQEGEAAALVDAVLRERDVAVLLFRPEPADLPVPLVVDGLTRAGIRVLEAGGVGERLGSTVVVVTRDPRRRQRVHVLGGPLATGEAALLRQLNEWALEGLQLRSEVWRLQARAAELEEALRGAARTRGRRVSKRPGRGVVRGSVPGVAGLRRKRGSGRAS